MRRVAGTARPPSAAPASTRGVLRVDIEKRLGGFTLRAALATEPGVLVLFGPSGAGKTTILGAIAGLVRPDAGVIALDDRPLFRRARDGHDIDVPPRLRRVGYVMQDYALFPHMSALDNVAYALRRAPDRAERARRLLDRMGMAGYAEQRPDRLSGGQQQRVAIARALATESPLLLLDEPFAALDRALRERLQHDLRALQAELGLIIVLVTHRLEDAFDIGDRLAIVRAGRIEQSGSVSDVFRRPANPAVAEILGIGNLIHARVLERTADGALLDWDGVRLVAPLDPAPAPGTTLSAYIRPEDVKIVYPDRPLVGAVASNVVSAEIVAARQIAATRVLDVLLPNGARLEVRFPVLSYTPLALAVGDTIRIALRAEGLVPLDDS